MMLAAFLPACMRAVEVPREDIAASAGQTSKHGWQIDTRSGQRFRVKNYTLTDSTLVIGELMGNDDFYGSHQDVTREIPLSDVSMVSRVKIGVGVTLLVGAGIVAAGWMFIWLLGNAGTTD